MLRGNDNGQLWTERGLVVKAGKISSRESVSQSSCSRGNSFRLMQCRSQNGVMVSISDFGIGELGSHFYRVYYIHLRVNNLGKGMDPSLLSPAISKIAGKIGTYSLG